MQIVLLSSDWALEVHTGDMSWNLGQRLEFLRGCWVGGCHGLAFAGLYICLDIFSHVVESLCFPE